MGKGDQKSRKGKITAGSYGKKRPRKAKSVENIPVKVLDENNKKAPKEKVREEVGFPTDKSENAEGAKKPKAAAKPKADKVEKSTEEKEAKPKAAKDKKTEE